MAQVTVHRMENLGIAIRMFRYFLWCRFAKGKFSESVSIADIAPTLSFILKIEPPVGNQGKILKDLLKIKLPKLNPLKISINQ